jgi:hypothetical protein
MASFRKWRKQKTLSAPSECDGPESSRETVIEQLGERGVAMLQMNDFLAGEIFSHI